MTDTAQERSLQDLARYARRAKFALIGLVLVAYACAYYVWTLGQTLGAGVIALFGYLVLRSRAKICYQMACRHYRQRSDVTELLLALDADAVAQGETAMRRQLQEGEGDSIND